MMPRSSLDDLYRLRLVELFSITGIDGILGGVLGKPFDTSLVTTGYITEAIGPICV